MVNLFPEVQIKGKDDNFRFEGFDSVQKKCCPQIFKSLQIFANGDVCACCADWKRIQIIENIQSESLIDIWTGKKLRNLQKIHLDLKKQDIEPCKHCTFNDVTEIDYLDDAVEDIKKRMKFDEF